MSFRSPTQPSVGPPGYYQPAMKPPEDSYAPSASPTLRTKRPRPLDMQQTDEPPPHPSAPAAATTTDSFIQDQEANDDVDDEDDDEDGKKDKKAGRRKIKIEFIQDKSRRHITFSKRKAGIMKKAYELSTLTGTQVLLLVVSETGLVYTFTTAKLQPLVTQPEGKNLIQACLNAQNGQLPSHVGPGQPMSRMNSAPSQSSRSNVPGGLAIGSKEEDVDGDEDDEGGPPATTPTTGKPRTRRRTSVGAVSGGLAASAGNSNPSGNSPTSPNQQAPPTPTIPMHQQGPPHQMGLNAPHGQQQQPYSQAPGQVTNVGYSNPPENTGYMPHGGHPQIMAQYHLNQQPPSHQHPSHWGPPPTQSVPQGAQYGRR